MEDSIHKKLSWIISHYGTSICDTPRRCEALLRDYCFRSKKEVFVLMTIVKEKMIKDILDMSKESTAYESQIAILINKLCDEFGFSEDIASWAVRTWAAALGVIDEDKVEEIQLYENKIQTLNIKIERPKIQVHKDVFETVGEFYDRIMKASPAPGGMAKLIKEQYDIKTQVFPVEVTLDDWCQKLYPVIDCNFYFLADRMMAKKIYEVCSKHTLYLNLAIRNEKVFAQSIEMHCFGKMKTIFREKVIKASEAK